MLDIVAQLRKCGLDSVISLPQLVVCGNQSAGKSSVLEALTEIPFPRSDNACTRFATEIILRVAPIDSISVKIIPDTKRSSSEQEQFKAFRESISDFGELPKLIDRAMGVMGIQELSNSKPNALFSKDVLSIRIEGPTRPQITLVDLPGLIQTHTKGGAKSDVDVVTEITDRYISQHRTICLAVVSASNDYANQGILKKVREVDPSGERTLGIITHPDRLPPGSGSEKAYLELARNEDVFFQLGWHVLKNRSFEDSASTFEERNMSELDFFAKSNFSQLPKDCVAVQALRNRLGQLLFNHVKAELPKLNQDLSRALEDAQARLKELGVSRTSAKDCRNYLTQLSLELYSVSKAAVNGHYEGEYFLCKTDNCLSVSSPVTMRRLRAVIQKRNQNFAKALTRRGHKYYFERDSEERSDDENIKSPAPATMNATSHLPITITEVQAKKWVREVIARTRGKELEGNFNPLLIGELFWEQAENWERLATAYVEGMLNVCDEFLRDLFKAKCLPDIQIRLYVTRIQDALDRRANEAKKELGKLMEDVRSFPINYNHYYTDTIKKLRREREVSSLMQSIEEATETIVDNEYTIGNERTGDVEPYYFSKVDSARAVELHSQRINPDMEEHTCVEALDCLISIYKVCGL